MDFDADNGVEGLDVDTGGVAGNTRALLTRGVW